jgi:hypothetical protein
MTSAADCSQDYARCRLLARREAIAVFFAFRTLLVRIFGLVAFLTMRRASGFAAVTLFVSSFWTDPALAAIVPSVAPMDSATLVRIVSSLDDLWLSTVHPFSLILTPVSRDSFGPSRRS